jgi:hypothetical protein
MQPCQGDDLNWRGCGKLSAGHSGTPRSGGPGIQFRRKSLRNFRARAHSASKTRINALMARQREPRRVLAASGLPGKRVWIGAPCKRGARALILIGASHSPKGECLAQYPERVIRLEARDEVLAFLKGDQASREGTYRPPILG